MDEETDCTRTIWVEYGMKFPNGRIAWATFYPDHSMLLGEDILTPAGRKRLIESWERTGDDNGFDTSVPPTFVEREIHKVFFLDRPAVFKE